MSKKHLPCRFKRRLQNAACLAAVALLLLGGIFSAGGFMGVHKLNIEERGLDIGEAVGASAAVKPEVIDTAAAVTPDVTDTKAAATPEVIDTTASVIPGKAENGNEKEKYNGKGKEVSKEVLYVTDVTAAAESTEKKKTSEENKPEAPEVQKDALAGTDPASTGLSVAAKAAVLIDASTGKVLFSQNGRDRLPPASVTKVMTMLLMVEAIDKGQVTLDDKVTISERSASMGGSQMYMEPGEQHSLNEIMTGISLVSANDACVAAAEYLCGSVEIFVEKMNERAGQLGMKDTNFVNTNGLPVADHYTSAYDIALMSRELIKHDLVEKWFTQWQTTITVGLPGKQTQFGLTNTNRLIKQYSGANGIKTGFTQDAGYCLSGSAERNGTQLIAVILGCTTSKERFAEVSKMLDYGFANYDTVQIAQKNGICAEADIGKGSDVRIGAVSGEAVSLLVKKGQQSGVTYKVKIDKNLSAPIEKGEKIGELTVYENEQPKGSYPLLAEKSVKKAGFGQLYARMMEKMM